MAAAALALPSPGCKSSDLGAPSDAGTAPDTGETSDAGTTPRFVAISAGSAHACAVRASGDVQCWGNNDAAQLGDGTQTMRSTPVTVVGLSGATAVSAGGQHTCAVASGGKVACWGDNALLAWVPALSEIAAVSSGSVASCALARDGSVWCWGSNYFNQLGPSVGTSSTPVKIAGLERVVAIDLGSYGAACAIEAGGKILCWGDFGNSVSSTPIPVENVPNATALSVGLVHACAVSEGSVRCWGSRYGSGPPYVAVSIPGTSAALTVTSTESFLLEPGGCFAAANGDVSCFAGTSTPASVEGVSNVETLTSGDAFLCALNKTYDEVRCWGKNTSGQIGNGRAGTFVSATGMADAAQISLGGDFACALIGGKVKCWGANSSGQLGDGTTETSTVPVEVVGLTDVKMLAVGSMHACAIDGGGEVWCWGNNDLGGDLRGALGDGTTTNRSTPRRTGLTGATQIAAGMAYTCAYASGTVWCWGFDPYNAFVRPLMQGGWSLVPFDTGVTGVEQLSASAYAWCALMVSGETRCFGSPEVLTPGPASPPAEGATAVAAAQDHTCALMSGGSVLCWASNEWGAAPGIVPSVEGAVSIASGVGALHSCAIVAGGEVRCWGYNDHGQLGDGTTLPTHSPGSMLRPVAAVTDISGARLIAVGLTNSCALVGGGDVRCWGAQQGDADVPPTAVLFR